MALLNILGKLFGNKYDKDVKSIMPIVDQINKEFYELKDISNDDLRDKTISLKNQVSEFTSSEKEEVENLKKEAESDISPEEKENLYKKIDKNEEEIIKQTEKILFEILPTAFAIVKETARRFTENETITVSATEFDKDLSATKDFVSINGNNAIYKNSWKAAGNEAKWEMVHYDVQLIGGIVMHQGKIAEMQTGEGKTLSATLPVFLNALAGLGVHLITVNNYLAKRDAEWMNPIYDCLGLSVGLIQAGQEVNDKIAAYESLSHEEGANWTEPVRRDGSVRGLEDWAPRGRGAGEIVAARLGYCEMIM